LEQFCCGKTVSTVLVLNNIKKLDCFGTHKMVDFDAELVSGYILDLTALEYKQNQNAFPSQSSFLFS